MAKKWQQVGYIGLDNDPTPFMGEQGAVQDYGAQQEIFGAAAPAGQQAYQINAPPTSAPRVQLPAALAQQMAKVPVEVFDIFPAFPNAVVSSALGNSVAAAETTIHTFTPPTGHYVVINPADITQEVLYEPFSSSQGTAGAFLKGLVSVYTRTGLQGFQQRLYHGGSEFHNPDINISSVGNRRRWQFGAVVSPGDLMETRFFHMTAVATASMSSLDHRVSVRKITP